MRKGVRSFGFTLIELLVVIAVIAILAALLFPVFVSAKSTAYQATCASNLSQFGRAFSLYASDYGRFPLPGGPGGTPSMFWLHSQSTGESRQVGGLWPYIRSRLKPGDKSNLWSCPLAAPVDSQYYGAGYSPGQNYMMNDYIRSGHSGQIPSWDPSVEGYLVGMSPSEPRTPSRLILLYEGVQNRFGFCGRHGSIFYAQDDMVHKSFAQLKYPNIAQNYHGGKSNFLFVDGHVKALIPSDTWSRQTYDVYKNRGHFRKWTEIYPGWGEYDMWNPCIGGVKFP